MIIKKLSFLLLILIFFGCNKSQKNYDQKSFDFNKQTATSEISDTNLKMYKIKVIRKIKHDTNAFTQGLFFYNNYLYESTGLKAQSSLRKIDPKTGEIVKIYKLPNEFFAEGITLYDDKIYQLTWDSNICFVYDINNFKIVNKFNYDGEGWGITYYKNFLVISDGTNLLRFVKPENFELKHTLPVSDNKGFPINNINELENINNEIWANIWQTNLIARINPETGKVISYIDLSSLYNEINPTETLDVLNGIAYDAQNNEIYVTGKNWPLIFVVELEI